MQCVAFSDLLPRTQGKFGPTQMPPELKYLSREDLYALVWAEPMSTIAPRFHLSDVGLKKICQKHFIPVPGRGYWQMRGAGMRVKQPPLPQIGKAPMIRITVRPTLGDSAEWRQTIGRAKREKSPESRIVVPESLEAPHAVTLVAQRALKQAKADRYDAVTCDDPESFSIRVTRDAVDRTLRIIDALAKACATRDVQIRSAKVSGRTQASLIVEGEPIGVSITERLRRHEYLPRDRARWSLADYDYEGTGELVIKIAGAYSTGLRSTWSDGRRYRLEDCLHQVIAGAFKMGAWLAADRRKREERERRFEVEQQRRATLRKRVEAERQDVARLEQDAETWQRAQTIRAYVDAVEAKARRTGTSDNEQAQRIAWARQQADRIDPLTESPSSILDTDEASMRPISLWEWPDEGTGVPESESSSHQAPSDTNMGTPD